VTATLTVGLGSLVTAQMAQAFDFGNMMNPSRWFGGDRDRYYDDYRYGRYGYGGPYGGWGGPYGGGADPMGGEAVPMGTAPVLGAATPAMALVAPSWSRPRAGARATPSPPPGCPSSGARTDAAGTRWPASARA
jgi:hypothetical protein